jgi:hypothetical protein
MRYEFTVERAPTYLHVKGSGDHTADNMRRFMVDAYRAAIEHDCDRLLMELNFTGPSLNFGAIYSVIADRSPDGSRLKRIACVYVNPEQSHEEAEFAELAATNRGVNVRFFPSLADARRSLQEDGECMPTPRVQHR